MLSFSLLFPVLYCCVALRHVVCVCVCLRPCVLRCVPTHTHLVATILEPNQKKRTQYEPKTLACISSHLEGRGCVCQH